MSSNSPAGLLRLWTALSALSVVAACAQKPGDAPVLSKARIAEIVASPDRTAADRTNDLRRKPEEMLAFIGVRPGMVALALSSGGGYTTELLARSVAPGGRVYAQVPRAASAGLTARIAKPPLANVTVVVQPFDTPVPAAVAAGGLDLATLMFNYHDLGHMGVDRDRMNRAVFAALKPGGVFVVADHAGRVGTGISEAATLHRVEEAFVKAEVERAGFRLLAAGSFLRNPNDPRDREPPEPAQPKDEFVLKFSSPEPHCAAGARSALGDPHHRRHHAVVERTGRRDREVLGRGAPRLFERALVFFHLEREALDRRVDERLRQDGAAGFAVREAAVVDPEAAFRAGGRGRGVHRSGLLCRVPGHVDFLAKREAAKVAGCDGQVVRTAGLGCVGQGARWIVRAKRPRLVSGDGAGRRRRRRARPA